MSRSLFKIFKVFTQTLGKNLKKFCPGKEYPLANADSDLW